MVLPYRLVFSAPRRTTVLLSNLLPGYIHPSADYTSCYNDVLVYDLFCTMCCDDAKEAKENAMACTNQQ